MAMTHRMIDMTQRTTIVLAAVFSLIVVGTLGIVGCAEKGGDMKGVDKYVTAVKAYDRGDREAAVTNLLGATRANPDLIMARVMLGDLYRAEGKYDDAVKQY